MQGRRQDFGSGGGEHSAKFIQQRLLKIFENLYKIRTKI